MVSDDLVEQCRRWLGHGRLLDLGRAVTYAVLSQRIRLTDADVDLLAELLAADGADTSALSMVDVSDLDPMPLYGFAPTRAGIGQGGGVAADARPGTGSAHGEPEGDLDRAAIEQVARHDSARALWRAWRYPGDGAPWPPPCRVYVLEVDDGAELTAITMVMQDALVAAGEMVPRLEVYPTRSGGFGGHSRPDGPDLPSYQRLARANGALLWARDPDPGVQVAAPWPAGDRPVQDFPVVARGEVGRLLHYLRHGEPLTVTGAPADDVIDAGQRAAVSTTFRTDGFWVWSEAATYYLERYGMAPDPGLLAHIRAAGYVCPEVDGAGAHRALGALEAVVDRPSSRSAG
jgi:hypothetical protein